MGLPVRQRRVLERIELRLQRSDPKLASLYTIFARLNRDEEMPRIEQVRHRMLLILIRFRLMVSGIGARFPFRFVPRQPALLFFPLAVAILVTSVVFAVKTSHGASTCSPTRTVAASRYSVGTPLCRPEPFLGH
jgi:hypothetical protein